MALVAESHQYQSAIEAENMWRPGSRDGQSRSTQTLQLESPTWHLYDLMLPFCYKDHDTEENNSLPRNIINIKAYHQQGNAATQRNGVTFKLTSETKKGLLEYYQSHLSDQSCIANYSHLSYEACEILSQAFADAINEYEYHGHTSILDEKGGDGGSEFPSNKSMKAEFELMTLLQRYPAPCLSNQQIYFQLQEIFRVEGVAVIRMGRF